MPINRKVGIKSGKSSEKVGIIGVKSKDSMAFPSTKSITMSSLKKEISH